MLKHEPLTHATTENLFPAERPTASAALTSRGREDEPSPRIGQAIAFTTADVLGTEPVTIRTGVSFPLAAIVQARAEKANSASTRAEGQEILVTGQALALESPFG